MTAVKQSVVALAGGVGGAKLAHGLARVLPPGHLTVIGNVGDDFERFGLHISPDLDTVMYTLAERANPAQGWGLADETWNNLDMMTQYGVDGWFRLGDRDPATHILRTHWLAEGQRLTDITRQLSSQLGVQHPILPATDQRLRTIVNTVEHGELSFQAYFVKQRWQPVVRSIRYDGSDHALPTPEVQHALENADVIVICPSNPILSIAPILSMPTLRKLLENRNAPCILVSPLIGGRAVKGPTDKLMHEMHLEASVLGVARYYQDLFDVFVIDTQDRAMVEALQDAFSRCTIEVAPTLMTTVDDRVTLAERILDYRIEAQ